MNTNILYPLSEDIYIIYLRTGVVFVLMFLPTGTVILYFFRLGYHSLVHHFDEFYEATVVLYICVFHTTHGYVFSDQKVDIESVSRVKIVMHSVH